MSKLSPETRSALGYLELVPAVMGLIYFTASVLSGDLTLIPGAIGVLSFFIANDAGIRVEDKAQGHGIIGHIRSAISSRRASSL